MGRKAGPRENSANWTLRIQMSVVEPLRTISKYTPLKPLVMHAERTAMSPSPLLSAAPARFGEIGRAHV